MANLFGTSGQFSGGLLNPSSFQQMIPYLTQYFGQGQALPPEIQKLIDQGTKFGSTPEGMDPQAVITAQLPKIKEQSDLGFAEAGRQYGKSGMLGSGYSTALGNVQRKAASDTTGLYMQYMSNAAENSANRQLQSRLAEMNNQLQAGLSEGGWANQQNLQDQSTISSLLEQQMSYGQRNNELAQQYAEAEKARKAQEEAARQASYTYVVPQGGYGGGGGYGGTGSSAGYDYGGNPRQVSWASELPGVGKYGGGTGPYGGYPDYQSWTDAVNADQRNRQMQQRAYSQPIQGVYNGSGLRQSSQWTSQGSPGQAPALSNDQEAMQAAQLEQRIKQFWAQQPPSSQPGYKNPSQLEYERNLAQQRANQQEQESYGIGVNRQQQGLDRQHQEQQYQTQQQHGEQMYQQQYQQILHDLDQATRMKDWQQVAMIQKYLQDTYGIRSSGP